MPQDLLDDVTLRWLKEGDDFHLAGTTRADQRVEDLEIPAGAPCQFVVLRIGKGPAGALLRLVDHLPGFADLDQSGQTEGAAVAAARRGRAGSRQRLRASPLPRCAPSPVLDNYGYNQNESRQLHVARDLLLVCQLHTRGGDGTLQLRIADGQDDVRADLDLETHRTRAYRNERLLGTAALPHAAWARGVNLEFALCDQQVLLAVDGRTVARWPYESPDRQGERGGVSPRVIPPGNTPQPTAAKPAPIRHANQALTIAARGMQLTVRRCQVFRDLVYLDPAGLGRDWTAPARLGPDEVLVLGDNVPASRDSRHWPQPAVPRPRWLGRVLTLPGSLP